MGKSETWKKMGARGKQGGTVGERETKGKERIREISSVVDPGY
jgi:hypothetical protein